MRFICISTAFFLMAGAALGQQPTFETDPNSPTLQALARPLAVDESKYGCGPLTQPGTTYYVSTRGDDAADGRSPQTAWRHVHHGVARLKPGDTLIIAEGLYIEPPIAMNVKSAQSGEPGRPITIMAAPRHRVIITGALRPELRKTPDAQFTYEALLELPKGEAAAWETDTQIQLQRVAGLDMVDELPATFAYDEKTHKIYVHFSDSRGPEAHTLGVCPGRTSISWFSNQDSCGLDIRASYVRFKGLHFMNYHSGMVIQGDVEKNEEGQKTYRGGDHVTVEDCSFSSTCFAGLVLYAGARWCLIKGNYGVLNGDRGSLLVNHADAQDNLFLGNWLDPSTATIREGAWEYRFGISTYGTVGPRNHIIGNVMAGPASFRTKFMFKETVLEGNVMTGSCSTVPTTYYELKYRPEERVIFRNNTILGPVRTDFQAMPPCGPGGNWCDEFKAFINNFAPDPTNREKAIEAARFADPAYLDYRLQADSPLRGKALGGGDIGAFRVPKGRVLYVSAQGNDGNAGGSTQQAFRTLAKAASSLQAGDTLYVMPGVYAEPLVIERAGTESAPITVRAYGKKDVCLSSMRVSGSWVTLEGFTVSASEGDGVSVSGEYVALKYCVIHDCRGSGVSVQAGRGLTLQHCTLVGNRSGLTLKPDCAEVVVRDCIFAANREGAIQIPPNLGAGQYLASHNCYFGENLDLDRIKVEWGSVVGDPKFVDAAKRDFRLRWDSPAAHLALYGRPAGARAALPRTPEIESIAVSGLCADSAVITWRTPNDDTTATVRWREKGATRWRSAPRNMLGTVHGVGLEGLKANTDYEMQIIVKGLRGGEAASSIQNFSTPAVPHAPTTYYVTPSGDDRADGLSLQTAWATLRRASFAVGPGDTVLIAPGAYYHPITPLRSGHLGRRITFRRHGAGEAILDGRGVGGSLVAFESKHYITIEGLIFDNLPPAGHPGVINVSSSDGLEVLNCRIGYKKQHGGFGSGIVLRSCSQPRIEGNVIWGTRYHCELYGCPQALIKNNTFTWGQVFSVHLVGKFDGTRVVNNIFYYPTSVPNAALAINHTSKDAPLSSDYNLFGPMVERTHVAYVYKGDVTKVIVPGPTLEAWQKNSGQDTHSIQADPKFVNPRAGDFRLQPDSPGVGAGENGAHMGACGVTRLMMEGRTALLPGEGRTIRLHARLIGPPAEGATFCWELPAGQKRYGATLEYTPPPQVNCFDLKLIATDAKGEVSSVQAYVSVPPPELAQAPDGLIFIEAESFIAHGGGDVQIHELVNASGKAITNWYQSVGQWLEWEFAVPRDGEFTLYARYATRLEERSRRLLLDGASPGPEYEKIVFPCTGGWSISEDNWAFKKLGPPVMLKTGKHRLRMINLDSAVNLDYIVLKYGK